MIIALGTDHAGFTYKELVKDHLTQAGHTVIDKGTFSPDPVDYPDFIRPAAQAVLDGEAERAIVFGGSGNGEAMTANRLKGIRCGLCWSEETARLTRQHNDANVLSMGARQISEDLALRIVDIFLETPFEGGRHLARIAKLDI
ncbi:ribose 5-phosphate isomerase B [Fibrella forsythiae]|uniref:Ribose 5-phosphate isomerase B n=1 Tax=Fibrella forsythiae TaxID=2817061 RepID=A0ABS3JJF0_9BACT|nr:ribose 5-phosphate isomerase B [Fibrella forsythiae]MBO0950130.1 ribose 5-phosphate isomerase B [Fibrella forsythiae]